MSDYLRDRLIRPVIFSNGGGQVHVDGHVEVQAKASIFVGVPDILLATSGSTPLLLPALVGRQEDFGVLGLTVGPLE